MMYRITFECDDHNVIPVLFNAGALKVEIDLIEEFGDDVVDDDGDIDPEMVLSILQGASKRMGHDPDAQRQLSDLVYALQAPPAGMTLLPQGISPDSDEAPPHGIPRPVITPDMPPRPNSTRRHPGDKPNTERRTEAMIIVRDAVMCPTCGAKVGEWCKGVKTGSYGSNHVHEARIDLVYGRRPR